MNLHRDNARCVDAGFGLGEVYGLHAIEPDLNVCTLCTDTVVVPFAERLARFLEHLF